MPSTSLFDYRNIIDSFKAKHLTEREIEQRLSDLMLVFDFSSSLNRACGIAEIADLLLLTLMGYTASRRSVFLLRTEQGLEYVASKGFRSKPDRNVGCGFAAPYPEYHLWNEQSGNDWNELCDFLGVRLLVPLHQDNKLVAVVGIGDKTLMGNYSLHELQIIVSLVQMCGRSIENAENHEKLQALNRQLSLKIYQLNTLFELSKDFNAVWDSETVYRILGTSLIGQLMISRCAVFVLFKNVLELKLVRGIKLCPEDLQCVQHLDIQLLFSNSKNPVLEENIPEGRLKEFLVSNKIHLIFPMIHNDEIKGLIFLGAKKNRKPLTQEDYDFITTLGNLALVSDENARMQQGMIEKQRMEKELAIARNIQVGLLPRFTPEIAGYEISSMFQPCYEVGGDYFDFLPVSDQELALVIGDVSGKSTPAALIMASLQASLRALASMHVSDPQFAIQRINLLLCESQSGKYVTFFYGILNYQTHQLSYVNAGHCPPLVAKRDGTVGRLEIGGTVMGFFPDANYCKGDYNLDPGDAVIFYTDGVSELFNSGEEEFGAERILQVLQVHRMKTVSEIREALVTALESHRGDQHQTDDITFILLKRME